MPVTPALPGGPLRSFPIRCGELGERPGDAPSPGVSARARFGPWERGRPARLNTCGPGAHKGASRPLEHLWACGPQAGGTPAFPGGPLRCFHLRCGELGERPGDASAPGVSARARFGPWERGRPARMNTCGPGAHKGASRPHEHLWACGPQAGGTPAFPGGSLRSFHIRCGERGSGRVMRRPLESPPGPGSDPGSAGVPPA